MCVLCQIHVELVLSFVCLFLWLGYVLYNGLQLYVGIWVDIR
jgi:hypothetical protein